ncbi:MAG: flagellar biosynthesis anti-sigma factor FlgM [Myxococcales bacterium]|nr:flagellar biosynthesis anti-sigma factor FlgM [Myxococcales bacterium]
MKIQGPHRPSPIQKPEHTKPTATGHAAPGGAPSVQVNVSSQARQLAEARAPEQPDEARVARLTDAIRNGTFTVDVDRIADAMLSEEL